MLKLLRQIAASIGLIPAKTYPYPAIDIVLPGERYLHLVGSVHMGTCDMSPLPAALIEHLQHADALIVEADIQTNEPVILQPHDPQPLTQRLSEAEYQKFISYSQEVNLNLEQLAQLPPWHIALMLQGQQAQHLGLFSEYGVDQQLLTLAHQSGKKVLELEGSEYQFNLLEQLPDDGLMLLKDTLENWSLNARMLQLMVSWWVNLQVEAPPPALPSTFSAKLYDVLMHQRNQSWLQQLNNLPAGRYVVAVGALHLYGEGNLPSLLEISQP